MSDPILKRIFNLMYPVGSIYMSVSNTSPAILFGGTWEQIKDRFLLCSGNTYKNGATGGSTTTGNTTLSIDQIPSHQHYLKMRNAGKWNWNSGSAAGDMMEGGYHWDSGNTTYNWLIENSPVGGGKSHNHPQNLPPYLVVNVWKRTA